MKRKGKLANKTSEMQFRAYVTVLPPALRVEPENTLHISLAGESYKVVGPQGMLRLVEIEDSRAMEFLRRGRPTW